MDSDRPVHDVFLVAVCHNKRLVRKIMPTHYCTLYSFKVQFNTRQCDPVTEIHYTLEIHRIGIVGKKSSHSCMIGGRMI